MWQISIIFHLRRLSAPQASFFLIMNVNFFNFLRKNTKFVIFRLKNLRKCVKFLKFFPAVPIGTAGITSLQLLRQKFPIFKEKNTKFVIFRAFGAKFLKYFLSYQHENISKLMLASCLKGV